MKIKDTRWVLALVMAFVLGFGAHEALAKEKEAKKEPAKTEKAATGKEAKKEAEPTKSAQKNEKVAVVNGKPIMASDLDMEMRRFSRQMNMMGQAKDPAQEAEMKKKVLDGLINRELLRQAAEKAGIKVSDAEVDEQIATLKKRFPSEEEFQSTMKGLDLTEETLRAQFAQDLLIKKYVDDVVASKVTVTDEEAKAFYDSKPELFKVPEMVRASHILLKTEADESDADKAKAKEQLAAIQKRIQGGEDFATVAKEVSQCPSSAKGGDLDFFQRGQMVGPFEDAAFALKPGEMSGIVETQFGYHLIKVTDHKDAGVTSFDEIKERIVQHLKQEKVNKQIQENLAELKTSAKIETLLK